MIITRKIEIFVKNDDEKMRIETYKYLRNLSNDVYKAANMIINNQWFNEIFSDRIIVNNKELKEKREKIEKEFDKLNEKIKNEKDNKKKEEQYAKNINNKKKSLSKLSQEARKKASNFFCQSLQNTTYQLIKSNFKNMPSYIRGALNNTTVKYFNKELSDLKKGKRSLRNYKKGMPIPFMKERLKLKENINENIELKWINNIVFELKFGRDKSNNKSIVKRILSGEYDYGNPSIQFKGKKLFLLLVVKIPDKNLKLKTQICTGIDLGINIPAYCALSDGFSRQSIGTKNDFLRIRMQMVKRRKNLQKSLTLVPGGKGRKKKLSKLESIKVKERNFVKTYNHMISNRVVKFAVDNNSGIIKLEFLEGYSENQRNNFILRYWSYYELQQFIKYKAEQYGIEVVFVDPYHTSQACALCGNEEKGQRENQADFICKEKKCKNFEKKINADYNAALNIAKSKKIVEKKEECEYYKKKKKLMSSITWLGGSTSKD